MLAALRLPHGRSSGCVLARALLSSSSAPPPTGSAAASVVLDALASAPADARPAQPVLGLTLGSGMGGVADALVKRVEVPFSEIPDMPISSVSGHAGKLILGELPSSPGVGLACLQGRVHLYEGLDPAKLRVPIYMLKQIGCEALMLTTAVGSTRDTVGPGELVCVTDHINLQARNPLIGPNDDSMGDRFPSLLDCYDPALRAVLHEEAAALDPPVRLEDGVYLAGLGPSFETPAEIRAFRLMGADVVGMSTVPEVIAARHCGLRVAAVAVVVNYASGMTDKHITHDETLHFSGVAANNMQRLTAGFVGAIADGRVAL